VLLWLWRRLVATAPIRPLAWEPPYAAGAAQEIAKRQKKKKKKKGGKICDLNTLLFSAYLKKSVFSCIKWGSNTSLVVMRIK